jgi:hypothetical protein
MIYFKASLLLIPGETEENNKRKANNQPSVLDPNLGPLEFKAGIKEILIKGDLTDN